MEAIIKIQTSVRESEALSYTIQNSNIETLFRLYGLHKIKRTPTNSWELHFQSFLDELDRQEVTEELTALLYSCRLNEFAIF